MCPRCGHRRIYVLTEGRWRCAACRYTFQMLTGRFAGQTGLAARQWLRLVARFVSEQTTRTLANELNLAYNTAYKAVTLIRLAILAASLDGLAILQSRLGPELGFSGTSLRPVPQNAPLAAVPVFGLLERGGMGLGLSISYGIIKDYGGDIEVASAVGQGTTFRLSFPAQTTPARSGA